MFTANWTRGRSRGKKTFLSLFIPKRTLWMTLHTCKRYADQCIWVNRVNNELTAIEQYWIKPLKEGDCIPAERRDQFVNDVFWNIMEVHHVNSQLAAALEARQKVKPVIDQIGDVILQHVGLFSPFVQYGAHQMISKYIFETEKSSNPAFAQFVEVCNELSDLVSMILSGYIVYRKTSAISQTRTQRLSDQTDHSIRSLQPLAERSAQAYPCRSSRSRAYTQGYEGNQRISQQCKSRDRRHRE